MHSFCVYYEENIAISNYDFYLRNHITESISILSSGDLHITEAVLSTLIRSFNCLEFAVWQVIFFFCGCVRACLLINARD